MVNLLLDTPWYLTGMVAVIGIVLWVRGNNRQNASLRSAGLAVLGLGILWFFLGLLIDTPKKICQNQTRQYVQAVVDGDWPTVAKLMDDSIAISVIDSPPESVERQKLTDFIQGKARQIGLKSAVVTDVEPKQSAGSVAVSMKIFSVQEMSMDHPIDSEWELTWSQTGNQWRLHQIRGIRVSGIEPGQIRRNIVPN